MGGNVTAAANAKKITINYVLTGSCSPYASAQFERVAVDGTVLGPLALMRGGNIDVTADEFAGSLAPPSTPFRVYARGVDASGNPFQRAFALTFRGQTVKVEATDSGATLQPGTTTLVVFLVTNLGAAGWFRITASDDARYVTGVEPSVVRRCKLLKVPSCWSFASSASLRKGFHSRTMRPFARLADGAKSFAIRHLQ